MATYTLISSNVLSSSAASVTFSAIPATYTDLVLRISARSDRASSVDTLVYLEFNGSSATNYSMTYLEGSGSAASSGALTASAFTRAGYMPGSTATANTFGSAEIYIPSYTASQNKPVGAFGVAETNATAITMAAVAGLWSQTAAITSIRVLQPSTALWIAGSSFYLYGISNA
jgi:hypothetical protein